VLRRLGKHPLQAIGTIAVREGILRMAGCVQHHGEVLVRDREIRLQCERDLEPAARA
jgi:hypothetical protein